MPVARHVPERSRPGGSRPLTRPAAPPMPIRRQPAKKRKELSDYSAATLAGAMVATLVIGFVIGWAYVQPMRERAQTDIAFAKSGPFHIETDGYTYNATLAIQSDEGNARWVSRHQEALNDILYRQLVSANPKALMTTAGLMEMQRTLTVAINEGANQPHVQQVLFTDFVIQQDY